MERLVSSADSHVLEPVDLWQREGSTARSSSGRGCPCGRASTCAGGTYPNTKAVLADIFDGVPDEIRTAITGGNFARLFTVPDPAVP